MITEMITQCRCFLTFLRWPGVKTQLHAGLQSVQVNQIYLRVRCAEVGQEKSNVSLLLRTTTSGGFEGAKTRGLTYL